MNRKQSVYIIGAGPSGLTAANELTDEKEYDVVVLEKNNQVGGISRTESFNGYLFDIGGHRFFSKNEQINSLWQQTLGSDFRKVRRMSRIYHNGTFFQYPLKFWQTIFNLGIFKSFSVFISYLKATILPITPEKTFEDWVINRFGKQLYNLFFKTYTEKVWGISCKSIQADWAAQRIQGLSFKTAIYNAVFGNGSSKTLINEFHYPVHGPGMMWNKFRENIESANSTVLLNSRVTSLQHAHGVIETIIHQDKNGSELVSCPTQVISSIPLKHLITLLDPPPPPRILRAAEKLSYRAFIIVILIIDQEHLFPDQWIYIHSPEVSVGRIQNFKNWSAAMVPDKKKTSLGLEYFCNKYDAVWNLSEEDLIKLATSDIEELGIADKTSILDSYVVRQSKAYPVYDENFKHQVAIIKDYLSKFTNLQTIGRNGTHRYNNMDHSMITGIKAAHNIAGAAHDIWEINDDEEYTEVQRC